MPTPANNQARWSDRLAEVAACTAMVLGLAGGAIASPGDLDPSFGGVGWVQTGFTGPFGADDVGNGVLVQPDGKVVVAGTAEQFENGQDVGVVRWNPDGSLDGGFGTGGKVRTDLGELDSGVAIRRQTDGKLLVAGTARRNDFAVLRYEANGTLDATFGTGGIVTTDISGNDNVTAFALQPDQKPILVGRAQGISCTLGFGLGVMRYDTNGTPDASFGTGGRFTYGCMKNAGAVALQSDGKIIIGGQTDGGGNTWLLIRLDTNGVLDPTFGTAGIVTTNLSAGSHRVTVLGVQSDDKIIAAGPDGAGHDVIARYLANGAIDSSFGTAGTLVLTLTGEPGAMMVEATRGITLAQRGGSGNFFAYRVTFAGALDPAFGTGGIVNTTFGGFADATSLSRAPDGRLVVGGSRGTGGGGDFTAARYFDHVCANGTLEPGEQCDDGNSVSGDCCSSACLFETGGPCADDGNACTSDVCDGTGTCTHPNNTAPCNDGMFCNGADTCLGGACSQHAGDPCASGSECADVCNEATDNCFDLSGTPCAADVSPCTLDVCDGAGACAHPAGNAGAICRPDAGACDVAETCTGSSPTCPPDAFEPNGTSCDDGLFCNGTDTCTAGACVHAGDPCIGGPVCADTCNETADDCLDPSGSSCTGDGNPCTLDQCDGAGACGHPAGNAGTVCRSAAGQCDATETCDGTSAACPADGALPDGTDCDDGDACTSGDECTSAACAGGSPIVCPLCETCDSIGGCLEGPMPGCKGSIASGKSKIVVKTKIPHTSDLISYKWSAGAETAFAELGDPLTTADYALCIYQAPGDTLLYKGVLPAGGQCGAKPCWKQVATVAFKYLDKEASPDGIQKLSVKSGPSGKAKLSVKAKGLPLYDSPFGSPNLPLGTPVRVQVQVEGGACVETTFSTPIANDGLQFKSKGD